MEPQVVTKLVKAGILAASLAGYEFSPEDATTIAEIAASLAAVVYTIEAWLKRRKVNP